MSLLLSAEIASGLDLAEGKKIVLADMDFPTLAYQRPSGGRIRWSSPEALHHDIFLSIALPHSWTNVMSRVFYLSVHIQDVGKVAKMADANGDVCSW